MADKRKADTMSLSGNEYAKVADRMVLFRTDWPNGKSQTAYENDVDGSVTFKAWLWKDKTEFNEFVKSGVTSLEVLRATADSDGDSKGAVGVKQKDFEKLQTIAMGRALANLGYAASGEIASFEEMEEYGKFKEEQAKELIDETLLLIKESRTNLELNKIVQERRDAFKYKSVVEAAKYRQKELVEASQDTEATDAAN